jgi:hypothetical protein
VQLHASEATDAQRRQREVGFQQGERPLYGGPAPVQPLPCVRSVGDGQKRDRVGRPLRSDTMGTQSRSRHSSSTRLLSYPLSIAHVCGWEPRSRAASSNGATYSDSWRRPVSARHASGRPVRVQASRCNLYP